MAYEYQITVTPKTRIVSTRHNRPQVRVVNAVSHRSFDAAKRNRLNADFNPTTSSLDRDIFTAMPSLRNRARELWQNDAFAKRAVRLYQVNIVGPYGFRLEIEIEEPTDAEKYDTKVIKTALKDWSRKENCTVTGRMSFRAVQRLMIANTAIDGESLARKIFSKKAKYGFALQPLEIYMLDEQYNQKISGGGFIRMGIEFDQWRKPVAYWLRQWDAASDLYGYSVYSANRVRIPASDIIHYFDPLRAFQTRGVTWFAQTLLALRHLSKADEAALHAFRAGASKMGFYQSNKNIDRSEWIGDAEEEDGSPLTTFEPGIIEKLPYGYEYTTFDPKYPDAIQEPFTKLTLRRASSGADLNYHDLANDYETTTYSSGRLASLTERELWKDHQELFIEHFLDDVYGSLLREGMMNGSIKVPYTFVDKYIANAMWYGRRWSWVDPLKDITAKILELRAGLGNASETLAEQGGNYEENIVALSKNKKQAEAAGLLLSIFSADPLTAGKNPNDMPAEDTPTKKKNGKATKQDILQEMYYLVDLVNRSNGTFEHA